MFNGVFTRRSQVDSGGNIGSVLRDGSSNFKTENLGNTANNGLFNTIFDNDALSGVGNQSFRRRAQVAGPGHVLSSDNDKSNNIHQSFQGEATNNGWGNTLTVNEENTGVSSVPSFVRRSIISEDSSKNLVVNDKSARVLNFDENDSVNQAAQGVNSHPFWWKRSIVDNDSSKNLIVNDKSTRFLNFEENDSVNQAAQGVNPHPFWWKRSIVDGDSSKNVVLNDKSTRVARLAEDNSVNQATQGAASSPLWKRSIDATLREDNSLNQFSQNGLAHPFFVKRTIFDSDSSDNVVFNDKSFRIADVSENASVNQALINGFW
ncbi:hypothetical protein CONCODRAFT_4163 [Conidiobolus coronatus NRRL 28638]|uniref:Uncharacterized protein n=1 Tax=Conidiobolus coronatus (strain ATCC 28846 / CBS 209.66 / NRRL 28638) TaxID=796925 RepID=A0A137PDG9_CONC2|nr:hypothetical protein CONCODRAFT_4163 [Conidiobolus coronatus NRRL 28638]|eukprot:KXN73015.1 hypothetical protein CONCODRAFT_4163 [Conidiobolus coronatus NRRL 28638]